MPDFFKSNFTSFLKCGLSPCGRFELPSQKPRISHDSSNQNDTQCADYSERNGRAVKSCSDKKDSEADAHGRHCTHRDEHRESDPVDPIIGSGRSNQIICPLNPTLRRPVANCPVLAPTSLTVSIVVALEDEAECA